MPTEDRYVFDISEVPQDLIAARAGAIFDAFRRFDLSAPGFGLLDLRPAVDSHLLPFLMLELKERLSEVGSRRCGVRFAYRSLGRFDQQRSARRPCGRSSPPWRSARRSMDEGRPGIEASVPSDRPIDRRSAPDRR